ncbi:MAG: hypothetical protein K2X31_07025 [Sphingopyxis sp.]|nr:hypothetical protein [Sphingopyxis sp.]
MAKAEKDRVISPTSVAAQGSCEGSNSKNEPWQPVTEKWKFGRIACEAASHQCECDHDSAKKADESKKTIEN